MNIIPANQLIQRISKQDIKEALCKELQDKIIKMNNEGRTNCCYSAGISYNINTGEITNKLLGLDYAETSKGWRRAHLEDYPEIDEDFIQAGYRIEPTGIIDGVMQTTRDICW